MSTSDAPAFVPYRREAVQPVADVAGLQRRAAELLPQIAEGAADRERNRTLPWAWMRRLAEAGLTTWRVPARWGGPGASLRDTLAFVIDLAAVDSNVAQSLRPAFGFVEGLRAGTDPTLSDRWLPRVLAGELFGNAGWERGGPNGQITARLQRDADGTLRLTGLKHYSTGALYADWVSTFALDDDGREVHVTVPRDRPGLVLHDDFDAMGQRLTASGRTGYDGVLVKAEEARPGQPRDRRTPVPLLYQLFLAALEAGIARNAVDDAVAFAQRFARPIRHSSAQRSVDDPYVQQTVGEMAAHAYAARAVVLQAADAVDAAWAADLAPAALTTASLEVAQAQFAAVQFALRAAELAFDVGGASALDRVHNLDRHWRNARTVANHNPRQWKAAVVGAHRLTGAEPPTSGLF